MPGLTHFKYDGFCSAEARLEWEQKHGMSVEPGGIPALPCIDGDCLVDMLSTQLKLQQRLYPDFLDWDIEKRVAYIKEMSIHLNQEVQEALYEAPFFKPWKDYTKMSEEAQLVAMQKVRCELIDSWHFFMNLMLAAGFTASEFYSMYTAKNAENHRRQDEGYDHTKKYREG